MPISPETLRARREYLGSSDIPAIMGLDPWRNAYDVYMSKTAGLVPDAPTRAQDRGNRFERALVQWTADDLGVEVDFDVTVHHPEVAFWAANLDGRVRAKPWGIEAKVSTSEPGEWGDDGTDHVPKRVIVQTQWQMMVAGLERVYVPLHTASHGRLEERMYVLEPSCKLHKVIGEAASNFWERHVLAGVPPEGLLPSLETLKRVERALGEVAIVDASLATALELATAARKKAEEDEEEAKKAFLVALGTAEAADFGDPAWWYTYREQSRETVDGKGLRLAHPEIFDAFARMSTFRVLRRAKRK